MTTAEAQSNLLRRVLVARFGTLSECEILELSPSKECVKIRWTSGTESWCLTDEYRFVEALSDPKQAAKIDLDAAEVAFQKWQYGKKDEWVKPLTR